jgi:aspartyl-tRNA synthetase
MRTLTSQCVEKIGEQITLQGWVQAIRKHGKITFIDLRDRTGLVQLVTVKSEGIGPEDVVEIIGMVKKRPDSMQNPNLQTGTVEIEVQKLTIISKAHELPFPIDTDGYDINEEIRSKYRYLDLRRPRMTRNIRLRSKVVSFIRNFLASQDFVEIETPILTKTTPEGARDFLVPSRLQPGKFYALPQSPQQYKQLLMVAGFERYFQIARCFRDEDPRRDRAYGEFTQLDVEMSFVSQEDILQLAEQLFSTLVAALFPEKHISEVPFPRLSHKVAIAKYGTDKPDLRKDKNDPNELAFSWTLDFPLFTKQSEEDFYHGSGNAIFAPSHHMFTAPHPDDIPLLSTDPTKVRGLQHDLVLNGFEIGGGSIRIHQKEVQEKIFDLIGFTDAQKQDFAHMLTAFTYGVPPHGGIAPGIDRFMMAVLGEPSVREVMAYPTSASGTTAVMDAPSAASDEQLKELGLQHVNKTKKDVYTDIVSFLDKRKIVYKTFEHKPVFTSEEAATVRNTSLHQGAKALIMIGDKKPLMIVLPADLKVNTKGVKELLHIKNLQMATASEVEQISETQIGAVPPLGNLFGIPLYVDERLRDNQEIVFNAGLHTKSIQMSEKDFEKVSNPTVGKYSSEK